MTIVHGPNTCSCHKLVIDKGRPFLLNCINIPSITGLNEKVSGSAKSVFKHFNDRLNGNGCSSCDDVELIIHVPFQQSCRLSSLHLIGGYNGTHPKVVKLYMNHPELDFECIHDTKPTQILELAEDYCGAIEYPLKITKFTNVFHLTLFVTENYAADSSEIYYIGLRGENSIFERKPVVTVYEARANPADHTALASNEISFCYF